MVLFLFHNGNKLGKKYGGREKGTPNRMTKELRSILKDVLFEEIEALQDRLDALNPKERVELLIKLMPYALPKVTSVSHTTNEPLDWG
jgi:hypothetical protein